jgi:glycosyltransferase involved in cell wall biosynthesis
VRALWSTVSYATLRRIIQSERPQVAHFHNTLPLISPSGYWAAAAEGVPVVQTLHNYRLLCCNSLLFRDGKPCEDCVGKRISWSGIAHSCYRESIAASFSVAAVTGLHRAAGTWTNRIDIYIAPSPFARSRFVAGGLPAAKIVVKPNFVHPDPGIGPGDGGFALFAGRLSPEKGVGTLLDAWERLWPEIPLKVVGDGPLAQRVADAARRERIEWLGRRPPAEVYELMGRARCVIVPSDWYEVFPRVVVEAFAKGTPVVASTGGAHTQLVNDGVTGFHFRVGDPRDLEHVVRRAFADPDWGAMRERARRQYESRFTGAANHDMLMDVYERAITARSGAARASCDTPIAAVRRGLEP